jgi:HAE1 family hydrophobic/amphiphilic exporter-1
MAEVSGKISYVHPNLKAGETIPAGNLQQFIDDVNSAVDGITEFPDDAEDPLIDELGRTSAVVSVAISAQLSPPELKALAEHYRDRLLTLPEIPMVEVSGFSTHELSVRVKAETLRRYRLSVQDIADLIQQQAVDLPAGILETDQRWYQIRVENQRRSVAELTDLVVLNDARGGRLRLGDIAIIADEFTDPEVRVELNGRLPESTRLVITQDSASIVEDRLRLLTRNGWQGLMLATLVLFLFFSWRYTFLVALGLPISFVGGLMVMTVLGITINMISMVALLMAIGILMDDAIVISESIENEFRAGKPALQAAVSGIEKVGRGVLSSFATSAMLFGSLLFLKGDMGQVMGVLPVVLLSVLAISLVEAFLILPHHLMHSLQHSNQRKMPVWRKRFEQKFDALRSWVGATADLAIRYRYLTVGTAIGLLVITISLDLLDSEKRNTSLNELRRLWLETSGPIADVVSLQFKEPVLGPAGQAISMPISPTPMILSVIPGNDFSVVYSNVIPTCISASKVRLKIAEKPIPRY